MKKNCKETQNDANIHCEINEHTTITVVLAAWEKHMEKLKAVCWCHGIVCSEFCPLRRPNRMTEKSDILYDANAPNERLPTVGRRTSFVAVLVLDAVHSIHIQSKNLN